MKHNIKEKDIIENLKEVKDPELGIDIYTLGLVYKIVIDSDGIEVLMTLTSPYCPFGEEIVREVEKKLHSIIKGDNRVEITFNPPWEPPEELRKALGI